MSDWGDEGETGAERERNPGPAAAAQSGLVIERPMIVAGLYVATLVLFPAIFVGLILAYLWRGDADAAPWEESHYSYLIRTFWIGLAVMAVLFVLLVSLARPVAVVGVMVAAVVMFVWLCVRSVLSLVAAANRRPIPNPRTWLF